MNRAILADMLSDEYDVIEAKDGAEALAILQKNSEDISLVMLDIVMPVMDGYEVLTVMNRSHLIDDIPVIIISSENAPAHIYRAYDMGVMDFINRPFDVNIVLHRVKNVILLSAKKRNLEILVADQLYERERANRLMVSILSHIVEFRNGESGIHVLHVEKFTEVLLNCLNSKTDKYGLTVKDIDLISTASALHDIGKIAIPDEILNKPGKLTPEEYEVIKTNPLIGAQMIKNLENDYRQETLLKYAYQICRWHHERYDGKGYPDGLKGEEIPIAAQVVAIVDVYDALTSDRCYKKAFSHEKAIQMILDGECGVFNPLLLDCLKESQNRMVKILDEMVPKEYVDGDVKKVAKKIYETRELFSSDRIGGMIEVLRAKAEFTEDNAKEIWFEYNKESSVFEVSKYAADIFGIERITLSPYFTQGFKKIFSDEVAVNVKKLLDSATLQAPDVTYNCKVNVKNASCDAVIKCRAVWTNDDAPSYSCVVGKIEIL